MEDVLDVYHRPRDERYPVVCHDEFCKQLLGEIREAQGVQPGQPARQDCEYVRHGSASAFVMYAPLEGRREVFVSEKGTRTSQDYAHALEFMATMFPSAEKIILVEDNLNTHCDASLYATFSAQKARDLANRFERHHSPKHGSWLNIAESEISALVRTGLTDRIETLDGFRQQLAAVVQRRNLSGAKTNWQFRSEDARVKLHSIYPSLQS
jgi:hypothetical protein